MESLTRIRAFLQVVEHGGFSAAARATGRSKALISKYVRELEDELGTRLLNRTTRKLSPTEAGSAYYTEAQALVQRLDELNESVLDSHSRPRGRLRVTAPRTAGEGELGHAIMEFVRAYPEIELDLSLDDRHVDLVEEGYDVAVRITTLADSSLIARRLSPFGVATCASPDFLERHGTPATPDNLDAYPCIIDTNNKLISKWGFIVDGKTVTVPISGPIRVNSPMAARQAALSGLGLALIPRILVWKDLEDGRLIEVLEDYAFTELGVHVVYPHRRHLSGKVRAFVDFLVKWFAESKGVGW